MKIAILKNIFIMQLHEKKLVRMHRSLQLLSLQYSILNTFVQIHTVDESGFHSEETVIARQNPRT